MEDLKKVLDNKIAQLKTLSGEVEEKQVKGITKTKLRIWVDKGEAWVGSKINVVGILTDEEGLGLPKRSIKVYVDGKDLSVTTDNNGSFSLTVSISHIYKLKIKVYATYTPSNKDVGVYAWSKSNIVTVKLLYDTPMLEVAVDKVKVKPLETFKIEGYIYPSNLKVWVKVFQEKKDLKPNIDGSFNLTIKTPANIGEGKHTTLVGPYAKNITAPITKKLGIEVYRLPVNLTFKHSPVALTNLNFEVSGLVFHNKKPLKEAEVTVEAFGEKVKTKTGLDGSFNVRLQTPYNLYTGNHPLTVKVNPKEPWFRSIQKTVTVPLLNLYMLLLPATLTVILIRRVWPLKHKPKPPTFEEVSTITPPQPTPEKLQGILKTYFGAVKLIQTYTGIELKPSDTVREYLFKVKPYLGEAYKPFKKLSLILEEVVYGSLEHSLKEAENLLTEIRERIKT